MRPTDHDNEGVPDGGGEGGGHSGGLARSERQKTPERSSGRRYHTSPEDRRAYRAKRRAAAAEGFVIHDVYWEDVHEWGAETAAGLAVLLRRAA